MSLTELFEIIAGFYQSTFALDNRFLAAMIVSTIIFIVLLVIGCLFAFRFGRGSQKNNRQKLTDANTTIDELRSSLADSETKVGRLKGELDKLRTFANQQTLLKGARSKAPKTDNALEAFVDKDKRK